MSKPTNNKLICQNQITISTLLPIDKEIEKRILLKENNIIVPDKYTLKELTTKALLCPLEIKNLHLGIIPGGVITRIKNEITDIKREKINELFKDDIKYALTINQEIIRHIKKDSLTTDDIINFITTLEDLITNFDTVRYTLYNNSQNALRFRKNMNNSTYVTLIVISNKNHTFRVHTIFLDKIDFQNKKRNIFPTPNESNDSLSKTS